MQFSLTMNMTITFGFLYCEGDLLMPFNVEAYRDDHIINSSVGEDFNINSELVGYLKALLASLDEMDGPSVCIIDTTGLNITFGSMTGALSLITHGELAFLKHQNICALLVITENPLII